MLAGVIKSNHQADSRRSYQCIKFLVNLANHCALAKDYLMQSATKWQWAVNWLKKKVQSHSYLLKSSVVVERIEVHNFYPPPVGEGGF